jgi:hypothetical protein
LRHRDGADDPWSAGTIAGTLEDRKSDAPASVPPIHASGEAPIFWEHEGNSAVRWGNHKLLHLHGEPWELYDMDVDRTELNNLIGANTPLEAELLRGYEGCPKQPG